MLVDDHAGFRQVVKALLQDAGAEFIECGSGREAVRDYVRMQPDLVLMDIAMKDVDGLTATAQIKSAAPTARIVMLTQYDDPELRTAAERAGAAGYLLKDDLSQVQRLVSSAACSKLPST